MRGTSAGPVWDVSKGLVAWIVSSVVGIVIVLLPDRGPRIVSFSEGHGPSLQDALGIAIALVGWLLFLIPLFRSRSLIERPGLLRTVGAAGAGVTVWSVSTDSGYWWVLGAGALAGVQAAAGLSVIRKTR